MPRNPGPRLITLLAGLILTACAPARGQDDPQPPRLRFGIALTARPMKNHFQDVVQKTPDLTLIDGTKTFKPSRLGLIYHVERGDRTRLLLSIPAQGIYGWASRDAVIPYGQAEGYFTDEIETRQESSFAYLMRAIVCEDNDRYERAFRDLGEALRLDPKNVAALIERSFLWASRQRMDLAMADANRALTIDPQSADALVERGVYHYRLKETQEALADLDRAWELGARAIYIPMVRGSIYVERRQLDDASKAFHDAVGIDPKSYDAQLMLGSVQLLRSQGPAAIQTFTRAIKLEPDKGAGYGGRAVAHMSLGHRKEALEDLNHAIRYDPLRADLFRDRGQVYAMEGQWTQALADMDTAIHLDANDVEAHVARAWTLATCPESKLRDGVKAVESATRACELTKWKSPRPLATLAAASAEKGDFAGAVQMQRKAIETTPEKDPVIGYYQACLERYRAGKPWHRLGVLEEMGLRRHRPSGKPGTKDAEIQRAGGSSAAGSQAGGSG